MKAGRWFFSLLLVPALLLGGLSDLTISKKDRATAKFFSQVEGKELLEVTDKLLASNEVNEETKSIIRSQKRRIFLFEYPSDGLMIKGYISYVPECEKSPLLVFLRGGAQQYRLKHPSHQSSFIKNYTVVSTTYRGGMNPGKDEFGGRDVNDVKNLIDYLPTLEEKLKIKCTRSKKYVLGWSRGGMQMMLALARFPELQSYFDKAVSMSGILDFEKFLKGRPDMRFLMEFGLGTKFTPQKIQERNTVLVAKAFKGDLPVLIVQGTKDEIVGIDAGKAMLAALKSHGAKVDYLEVEGGDHCLYNVPGQLDLVVNWLEQKS